MFEFEQEIVDSLLSKDESFKRLYDKHCELKQKVKEANNGVNDIDEFVLEDMKKEKLLLKDQMASMIDNYRRSHATA